MELDYNSLKFHSFTLLRHGQRSKYVNTKYSTAWVIWSTPQLQSVPSRFTDAFFGDAPKATRILICIYFRIAGVLNFICILNQTGERPVLELTTGNHGFLFNSINSLCFHHCWDEKCFRCGEEEKSWSLPPLKIKRLRGERFVCKIAVECTLSGTFSIGFDANATWTYVVSRKKKKNEKEQQTNAPSPKKNKVAAGYQGQGKIELLKGATHLWRLNFKSRSGTRSVYIFLQTGSAKSKVFISSVGLEINRKLVDAFHLMAFPQMLKREWKNLQVLISGIACDRALASLFFASDIFCTYLRRMSVLKAD